MRGDDMSDREKVIKGLELCEIGSGNRCYETECPYYEQECTESLKNDILALLKKREPILLENQHKPYGINTNANSPWISRCPRCGKKVEGKQTRFCKYCGQAVKWDA